MEVPATMEALVAPAGARVKSPPGVVGVETVTESGFEVLGLKLESPL